MKKEKPPGTEIAAYMLVLGDSHTYCTPHFECVTYVIHT
jgi:hypothetical protein